MKTNYLFPNSFKKISGIVFLVTLLVIIFQTITNNAMLHLQMNVFALTSNSILEPYSFVLLNHDIYPELLGVIVILSGLVFSFSKEKMEDEMISKIRLESLVWATYFNYAVLLFCIVFIYGSTFLCIMIYNMFILLFFFTIRFHWMLYKNYKINRYEE